jgi:hypothetical protein
VSSEAAGGPARQQPAAGDPDRGPAAAQKLLDDLLPADRYPRERLHGIQSPFTLAARPTDRGRDRKLTFEVL